MFNRNIYYNIVLRVSIIILTSLAAVFLTLNYHQWIYFAVGMVLLTWQTALFIYLMNRTNRQLAFFFDAIRNEDSTLRFPDKTGNKTSNNLYRSMNRLNELISQAKMQNRIQEQYYETILEHAATGLLTFDTRGNVLMANSAARRLLGCEPLTHILQLERVDKDLSKEIESMATTGHKLVKLTNERGTMQLSLRATSMMAKNKKVTLLSIQDIRNELDEKETESWIRLIRVLTHEIMNSIAPITSLSETLAGYFENEKGPMRPEEIDEVVISNTSKGLSIIRERGKGLVSFVESYRQLTHLHTPELQVVDLQVFLDKVKMLLLAELNFKHIQISDRLEMPGMVVKADENLLAQVIINLVRNSWEALRNQASGIIDITAHLREDNQTVIEVIDNGPGIPSEILDKIFIPFFTTRENGSGIGLSLSRQIMRLHGGTITVQSKPGRTCFELVL